MMTRGVQCISLQRRAFSPRVGRLAEEETNPVDKVSSALLGWGGAPLDAGESRVWGRQLMLLQCKSR